MTRTKFSYLEYDMKQLVPGYTWNIDKNVNDRIGPFDLDPRMNPTGGLRSTVLDLSHFLSTFMNGGVYNGTRILKETSVDIIRQNQGNYFGLGWVTDFNDYFNQYLTSFFLDWPDLEGFYGDWVGFFCIMEYNKVEGKGVVLFTNQGIWPGDPEKEKIHKKVLDLNELIVRAAFSLETTKATVSEGPFKFIVLATYVLLGLSWRKRRNSS